MGVEAISAYNSAVKMWPAYLIGVSNLKVQFSDMVEPAPSGIGRFFLCRGSFAKVRQNGR